MGISPIAILYGFGPIGAGPHTHCLAALRAMIFADLTESQVRIMALQPQTSHRHTITRAYVHDQTGQGLRPPQEHIRITVNTALRKCVDRYPGCAAVIKYAHLTPRWLRKPRYGLSIYANPDMAALANLLFSGAMPPAQAGQVVASLDPHSAPIEFTQAKLDELTQQAKRDPRFSPRQ